MLSHPKEARPASDRPWRSQALQSALWVAVACAAALHEWPTLRAAFWPPREFVSDFFQDWASARNVIAGLPVYTDHTQTIPRYVGAVDPICYCNTVNAHPPTSVLLLLPVAPLGYRPALLVWNLAGLVMLGASLWVVSRQLEVSFSRWAVFPALALLMLCRPLVQQLFHGQLNLVLLLLITLSWALERSGRTGWAGALVGAAAAIKVFPGFLLLYFLLRRQWKALFAGVATLALFLALTAAVLGSETILTYARDVMPRLERFRSSWFNASLVGFWTKLFDPATREEHVEPLWRSAAAARAGILFSWAAVVAILAWSVQRAKTGLQIDHAFGVAVTGMLLLSPITWDYGFLLLLVPLAVLVVDPPVSEPAKLILVAALAALWLWQKPLCEITVPGGISGGIARPVHTLTVLSYPCYALVALAAAGAAAAAREERRMKDECRA
jgi:alpha-1,2-mannosyltransferase